MEATKGELKTCPECSTKFNCSHDAQCWCMDYTISKENLELIKNKYSNCLCPSCLDEYQSPEKKGSIKN